MLRSIHGREVWIDAVGRLIEWEGGPAFLLSVVDVTDRHRSEKALIEKSKELEELNLQKDKLFSIIAHDLKGPFNSVLGFAGLLAAKAPKMAPEKVAEYAEVIYTAATSVHDLLDNLLTWASVQMRTTQLRKAPIDLHAVVDASFYPLQGMANEKAITVSNDIQDVTALGDEAMVRIVLRNLISNGIKFTPKGGTVTVSAEVQSGANAKPFVRVCVCDSGVGMSRATLDSLFSFTGQTSSTGTQGEKGTGLGLFLCRDIVERHGGRLTVESQPGKGSALTFTLPLPPSTP